MTTLEKAANTMLCFVLDGSNGPGKISSAGSEVRISGEVQFDSRYLARAAIEALRTPGTENTDRIFNAMLDRILKEEV